MALIPEDGSGLSNANSYQALQSVKDYWNQGGSFGIIDISANYTDAQIESAMITATRYMERNYSFKGSIVTTSSPYQALAWPRQTVVDDEGREIADNIVPGQVKEAHSEYTYIQLNNSTNGGVQPSPAREGVIKRKMTKLDALEKETEYESGTQAYTLQRYPYADNLMNGLTTGGPSSLSSYVGRGL